MHEINGTTTTKTYKNKQKTERKSLAVDPTECWAASADEWVRQENYLAGRSGSGKTLPFNINGEVPLERGTASCDRWLESTELCFAGGELTSKCKQGWFRPRNDKECWGSNLRSSASLVSYTGFLQMLVGVLCNTRRRLVLLHDQLNSYWGCVGLIPAWACHVCLSSSSLEKLSSKQGHLVS